MVYRPTSKVTAPSKAYWSPLRTRTPWLTKVGNEYIRETSRTFGERFKERLKEPSPIHHHSISTGHPTTQHNFKIIGREGHGPARTIKESIYIRVNNPALNRNIGKYNLHHIWDRVLLNTPGLKIKRHMQGIGHAQNNQPNTHTSLSQPNTPMQFFTGSMEHAQRTPLSEHVLEPLRTYVRHWISFLPQTWWSASVVGWKLVLCNIYSVVFYSFNLSFNESTLTWDINGMMWCEWFVMSCAEASDENGGRHSQWKII